MLIIIFCFFSVTVTGQEILNNTSLVKPKKLIFGIQAGAGWAYEDETNLFNTAISFTTDYRIKNNYFIQFAPQYSWLWKWNEHYLTFPVHLRKKFGSGLSLFAGPALTFDVPYFKDLGISGGAYFHFSDQFALAVSVFSYTLYDYYIDYLYVPVSISCRLCIQ
jgi:hypothetical protein